MTTDILNIGAGRDTHDRYHNLDVVDCPDIDTVHDLNDYPYPFDDDRFNEIRAFHILEHINADVYMEDGETVVGDAFRRCMDELHRILHPNGTLIVETPHFTSFHNTGQYQHRRGFHHESFRSFTAAADETYTDRLWTVEKTRIVVNWLPMKPFEIIVNASDFTRHVFTATPLRHLLPQANISYVLKPVKGGMN